MPLAGALAGQYLLRYVSAYDHWIAFGLLEIIGGKMLIEALWLSRHEDPGKLADKGDPSVGLSLLGLSIATSIDAFGAGIAIQIKGANLWVACPVIGIVCAILTWLGAKLGRTAEKYFGKKAEVAGGIVLIALGIKMLWV